MFLRHAIEVGHRQVAALQQIVEVVGEQPFTRWRLRGLGAQTLEKRGPCLIFRVAGVDEQTGGQRPERRVMMGIDQARQHAAAAEIDDTGRGTLRCHDIGFSTDRQNPAAADRHRLDTGGWAGQWKDRAAAEDHFCGVRGECPPSTRCRNGGGAEGGSRNEGAARRTCLEIPKTAASVPDAGSAHVGFPRMPLALLQGRRFLAVHLAFIDTVKL